MKTQQPHLYCWILPLRQIIIYHTAQTTLKPFITTEPVCFDILHFCLFWAHLIFFYWNTTERLLPQWWLQVVFARLSTWNTIAFWCLPVFAGEPYKRATDLVPINVFAPGQGTTGVESTVHAAGWSQALWTQAYNMRTASIPSASKHWLSWH